MGCTGSKKKTGAGDAYALADARRYFELPRNEDYFGSICYIPPGLYGAGSSTSQYPTEHSFVIGGTSGSCYVYNYSNLNPKNSTPIIRWNVGGKKRMRSVNHVIHYTYGSSSNNKQDNVNASFNAKAIQESEEEEAESGKENMANKIQNMNAEADILSGKITRFLTASSDGAVKLWSVPTTPNSSPSATQELYELASHEMSAVGLDYSPVSPLVFSGSRDYDIKVSDTTTGQIVANPSKIHRNVVTCIKSFGGSSSRSINNSNPDCFVQLSEDLTMRVWDPRAMRIPAACVSTGPNQMVACDLVPGSNEIIMGSKGFSEENVELKAFCLRTLKIRKTVNRVATQSIECVKLWNSHKNLFELPPGISRSMSNIRSPRASKEESGGPGSSPESGNAINRSVSISNQRSPRGSKEPETGTLISGTKSTDDEAMAILKTKSSNRLGLEGMSSPNPIASMGSSMSLKERRAMQRRIVIGSKDGTIKVFDSETLTQIGETINKDGNDSSLGGSGQRAPCSGLCIAQDGTCFAISLGPNLTAVDINAEKGGVDGRVGPGSILRRTMKDGV